MSQRRHRGGGISYFSPLEPQCFILLLLYTSSGPVCRPFVCLSSSILLPGPTFFPAVLCLIYCRGALSAIRALCHLGSYTFQVSFDASVRSRKRNLDIPPQRPKFCPLCVRLSPLTCCDTYRLTLLDTPSSNVERPQNRTRHHDH